MAVAAGTVDVEQLPALIAGASQRAERFGAAVGDGVNDRAMAGGNRITAGGTIGSAVGAKDFSEADMADLPDDRGDDAVGIGLALAGEMEVLIVVSSRPLCRSRLHRIDQASSRWS